MSLLQAPDGDGSAGLLHQVKELQLANTELQQQLQQQSRTSGARPLLTARSSAGGTMAAAAAAAAASNNLALVQQLQEQQQQAEHAVEQKSEWFNNSHSCNPASSPSLKPRGSSVHGQLEPTDRFMQQRHELRLKLLMDRRGQMLRRLHGACSPAALQLHT